MTAEDVTLTQGVGTDEGASGTAPVKDEQTGVWTITVWNSSGYELPNTGGPGTLTYALGGLMLLIISAVMYGFTKRQVK